jgi:hypothetical protein
MSEAAVPRTAPVLMEDLEHDADAENGGAGGGETGEGKQATHVVRGCGAAVLIVVIAVIISMALIWQK